MKHLGDICKINGAEIEPVDCITGGSPCQDLSIAGKRAGLAGERSGLFMEQVRIVKEMRERDKRNGRTGDMVRPRFLVWENVPGAFSSNGGGDFQAVLEEIIHIAEPTVSVPRFEGKWTKAGAIDGDGWSVAWRTHDAQYWGVPQRRRRISVVADFGGQSAGEILFERQGLHGDIAESGAPWKAVAGDAADCAGTADKEKCYGIDGYNSAMDEVAETIGVNCGMSAGRNGAIILNSHSENRMAVADAANRTGADGCEGELVAYAIDQQGGKGGANYAIEVIPTLCSDSHGTPHAVAYPIYIPYTMKIRSGCEGGGKGALIQEDKSGTLGTGNDQTIFCFGISAYESNAMKSSNPKSGVYVADTSRTLDLNGGNPACNQGGMAVVCAGFKPNNGEKARSIGYGEEQSPTLNAERKPAVLCLNDQGGNVMGVSHDVSCTMRAQEHGHQPTILDMSHACDVIRDCGEVDQNLQARMGTGGNQVPLTYQMQGFGDYREGNVASSCKQRDFKDGTDLAITNMAVRRLTPMECERLQGFPDGWTDIGEWIDEEGRTQKQADSPRYKALGNSIALPFWYWMFCRMAEHLPEKATLGSLFDGIGGFPLCWESIHGKGTARWASEIEKFPIAVTKLRFPEES